VRDAIAEVAKSAADWEETSKGPDGPMRERATDALSRAQTQLTALTALPIPEILEKLRAVHSKFTKPRTSRETREDRVREVKREFPGLLPLYPLLQKRPWGYRLGQALMAAELLEQGRG
jgi:hypothetical protein